MAQYNRIILGKSNQYVESCYNDNFIGVDFGIHQDLSQHLPEQWKSFNQQFIPVYLQANPQKKKVAAGLSCGMLWTVCKGLQVGDIVICPKNNKEYYVGKISGNYYYQAGEILPHRRPVEWMQATIDKSSMSDDLRHSAGSIGTCCNLTKYAVEIETLINSHITIISCNDEEVEDPSVFALEKHLEDFLILNWSHTPLGKKYNIYEEEGELIGQQYPTDTGNIDILAISKDKKTLLVVELKKGRTSDAVVGQIQRYMGYIKEEVLESDQQVKGIIIGLEADNRLKRALTVTTGIEFYRYQIDFKLHKGFDI